jgi:hypothetical protein
VSETGRRRVGSLGFGSRFGDHFRVGLAVLGWLGSRVMGSDWVRLAGLLGSRAGSLLGRAQWAWAEISPWCHGSSQLMGLPGWAGLDRCCV